MTPPPILFRGCVNVATQPVYTYEVAKIRNLYRFSGVDRLRRPVQKRVGFGAKVRRFWGE